MVASSPRPSGWWGRPSTSAARGPTVTGTANVLAAVLARGTTLIHGAAQEPEIVALGELLNAMGAELPAWEPRRLKSGREPTWRVQPAPHRRSHRGRHGTLGRGHHRRPRRGDRDRPGPSPGLLALLAATGQRSPSTTIACAPIRRAAAAGGHCGRALSRSAHGFAGPVDGPDVTGPGPQHGDGSRLPGPFSACGRTEPPGGLHYSRRRHGEYLRGRAAQRRSG